MSAEEKSVMNIVLYNGLCNRLLPMLSGLRLARKCNKVINIQWTHTPIRSCLYYNDDICKLDELYEKIEDVNNNEEYEKLNFGENYDFQYWLNKDHIIDLSYKGNTYINYALYTLISSEDNTDIFKNLKTYMNTPKEVILDDVGIELSELFKNSLKPVKPLQNEIDKCYKTFKKNMIGLHLRSTDGGFVDNDWEKITNKLLSLCDKWCKSDKDNGVYLATDDLDIYIKFVSKLGINLTFYSPPKVLCGMTSNTKFNNDKYNVFCAVIELHLLGKCNNTIIGTCDSTFSMCGLLLSDTKTKKYLMNTVDSVPNFI